ncbi:Calponin homology domain [Pseudocohnilembus persalinus]|uniref:Calponin homology domain n=1 Tax=Pseudocohnilembus persalinus TaxID=266149 RepID=A0A0V0QD57_PSEPJ|nr:Calponin homology domain [Pseudocohnilembus persalinus]|eukprot:KRX00064.1 Calponin homology domain [Pseudocohnilembus persalinus]
MYQTQPQPQPQEKLTASKLFFNSNHADSIIQNEFKKIKEQQKQNQKLQEEQNTFRQSLNQQTYHTSLNEQTPIHLVSNQSIYSNGLNQINSAFKKSQLQEEIVSIQRTIEQEKKDLKRHNSSQKFLKQQMPVFQFQYKAKLSPQNKNKKNLTQKSNLASNFLYSDIQQNGQNGQNNLNKKNNDLSQNYNQNSIQNSPADLNYEQIINPNIKIQEKYFSSQKPTQIQNNQDSKVSEYAFCEQSQNNFDQINSNQIELIVNWLYNLGIIKDRSTQFIQNLSNLSKNGVFIIDLLNRANLGVFKDPTRNGIFLIQLAEKLNQQIQTFFPNPQNLEECKFNIISAFEQLELPQTFDYEQYALGIMSGKPRFLTQAIYHLIENQSLNQNKVNQQYSQSQSQSQFQTDNFQNQSQNSSNFQQKSFSKHSLSQMILPQYQQSIRILPYTEQQLENLKQNTINWLQQEFQINYLDQPIQNFQQLLPFFRNGLLFFTIFSQILLKNITPVHINPLKNSQQIANINKILDQVRKNQNFGQKFLWSQEQIAQGNDQIILGLIEDLRRFQDNLPPRQQPDYFKEGPYLGIEQYLANKNQNQNHNSINQNQNLSQQKNDNQSHFSGKQNNQYQQVNSNQDKLKSSIKNFRPSSSNFNYNNNSSNQSKHQNDINKNILQKSQKIKNYVREIQDSADLNKSRKIDNLNQTKSQFYNIREQQQSRQNSIQLRQSEKNFLNNYNDNQNNSYNFNENNTQFNNINNNPFNNQNQSQSQRIPNSQLIRNQSFSGHFQNHSPSQQKQNIYENYNNNLNQNSKQKQRQSMNPFFISQNQYQFSQTQNPQNQYSNNQNFSKNNQISTKKPKNGILKNFSTIKKNNNSFHSQNNSFYEEINENSNLNQLINKIIDWLSDHGFAEFALQLDFYQPVIEELQDGIFLSKLVEQLEMKNIDGIIQKPTTKASCIVNIRKIFEILKKNKKMDPQLLSQPEKLLQADNTYILNLLNNIRKAYDSNYGQSFKSLNQTGISNINSSFNNTYLKNKSTQLQSPKKKTIYQVLNRGLKSQLQEND